ncbi:hypothetical protein [Sphingomonas sp. BK580]|uniref:hypothetical protein n=1 Tax=Sphingomonas sp. BK580 TaxID=2586972 RepID=UPI00161171DD|nr:hypothetical protein [Sphingomonas sp. BK580]MBB3693025.1 hypothetical protein [Sphingomonas sp. BK580]
MTPAQRHIADERLQAAIGSWVGGISAAIAFFGAWVYCMYTYGFLLGFGFGWVPSAILALFAYAVGRIMWPLMLVLVVGCAFIAFGDAIR